jgi:hypothetical protein
MVNGDMFLNAAISPDFNFFSSIALSNITVKSPLEESSLISQLPNLGTKILSDWTYNKKTFFLSVNNGSAYTNPKDMHAKSFFPYNIYGIISVF